MRNILKKIQEEIEIRVAKEAIRYCLGRQISKNRKITVYEALERITQDPHTTISPELYNRAIERLGYNGNSKAIDCLPPIYLHGSIMFPPKLDDKEID